jgi:hypothetical protein
MIYSKTFQKELGHDRRNFVDQGIFQNFRRLWSFRYVIYFIYERKDILLDVCHSQECHDSTLVTWRRTTRKDSYVPPCLAHE